MRAQERCERLAFDEAQVKKYYPQFRVNNRTGDTYYVGSIRGNGYRNSYRLKAALLPRYPYKGIILSIESPRILRMHDGRRNINDLGISHAYHVNGTGKDGCVKICFCGSWKPSYSCVLAIWRGEIWTAAYEVHLITGATIAKTLNKWKKKLKHHPWIW